MKLSNPPCRRAKECLPFCGMCTTRRRKLTEKSLFGVCRKLGICIDGLCYGASIDRPAKDPIYITDAEWRIQSQINKEVKQPSAIHKEIAGMYGGSTWFRGKTKEWKYNGRLRKYVRHEIRRNENSTNDKGEIQ